MRRKRIPGKNIGGGDPLLRAALGSMPYGFSIWDDERRLILFNQHYLDIYGFPPDKLVIGMSLLDMCRLTTGVGNHPEMTAEALFAVYDQRFTEARDPQKPVRAQKAIRGRMIRTSHIRSPELGWIVMHEDVTEETEQQWMAELREKTLAEQNLRFNAALSHMSHGLSMYDAEHRLVICNERYREMYGMPAELCRTGTSLKDMMEHRKRSGAVPFKEAEGQLLQVLDEKSRQGWVQAFRMPDGRVISVTQSPMSNGGFVTTHQDVTLEVERLQSLQRQNMRFDAAVNNMSQGLCMFDGEQRLVVCNEGYARLYRLPPELTRPGTLLADILEYRFSHGMRPKEGRETYLESRRKLIEEALEVREEVELEDGRTIAAHNHPTPDGGWVATHEDVTEQRRNEAKVRHLARHDALTDLPNRVLLREEMDKLEARIARQENVAVLCLDLDHFKAVNDTLGHGIGDKVLVEVARRLRASARESDVVARLGGDEFAILVHSLETPQDAATIAARIVKSIGLPMQIDGHHVSIGTSVGIALAPVDGQQAETLLRNADLALYRAKGEGRGAYHFFEKGMDEALQHRRMLEADLRVALARDQFRLMFQPLLDLAHNRVCCFEALLRWDHPTRGPISPNEFIPIAEETGTIGAIGDWVLRQACHTAASWPEHVRVAVNLSAVQFKNRGLVDQVTAARARSDRVVASGRDRADASGAASSARPGGAHLDGRLRHRLLVPELPARLPLRQDQDRPNVHERPGTARELDGDHQGGHRPWAEPWDVNDRRGDRDGRAARGRARAGLQRGSGLPVLAAAARLGGERAARHRRADRAPAPQHSRAALMASTEGANSLEQQPYSIF
jgi:diguanylate cyclase (GGDEF)-like protein